MRENRKIMIEKDGIKKEFRTMQQAADYIGCSKMLISLVLNPKKDNKRAKGWDLWIDETPDDPYTWK